MVFLANNSQSFCRLIFANSLQDKELRLVKPENEEKNYPILANRGHQP